MSARQPRIWVMLGHRTGDNNQLLALAEAMGVPFETRTMHFNWLRVFQRILPASLLSLKRSSRSNMAPPWPDLVMGIGWRSVPVARWIHRASGGRAKLVRLGDPRVPARHFDLLITTPQYPVAGSPNVLKLPIGMSRYKRTPVVEPDEAALLAALQRPRRLLAVGGPAKFWRLGEEQITEAVERLSSGPGSLLIVTSPRTPEHLTAQLRKLVDGRMNVVLIDARRPRFPVLLADSDAIFVTGDSIAMLSEAVLAGKPVGIVPVALDERGRRVLEDGSGSHRDLRRFWASLQENGLAGTIDAPLQGAIEDPARTAANAVLALLGDRVE